MQTISSHSLILGFVLTTFGSVTAQADGSSMPRIFGYEDPQTGVFHAVRPAVAEATTAPTTGTVEVTFSVKLVSSFAKGTPLTCSITLSGTQVNTTTYATAEFTESAGTAVTITGTTASCTATIPYSWLLLAASSTETESFGGSYFVYAGTSPSAVIPTGTYRSSSSSFLSTTKIPASGTTSKYTVDVTL